MNLAIQNLASNTFSPLFNVDKLMYPFIQYENGRLEIQGMINHPAIESCFNQVLEAFENDLNNHNVIMIELTLDALNTPTLKMLFDLCKLLADNRNKEFHIQWNVSKNNTALIKTGLDLNELFGLNFQFSYE
ncbi:SiaC family regulatory phosphoprotein [Marinoscillum furvescens]|uniref:Uncharacterized protein DUF1987 n=1 Tax=Marinoscillum furvescens DSM 4134 TaxID=1122208 RepID=A0A3D9KZG9_MARFU|nr:SiaC family regulatory phosphoprotein [Marinoscillum furvescens]RED93358.1 uncharacterized protein DUF1987 [Marinoscillum furvescens DSM 4134]